MSKDRHHGIRMVATMLVMLSLAASVKAANWSASGLSFNSATGNASGLRMVSDGRGGFIAAWIDARVAPTQIFCQRVDSTGTAQWAPDGLLVSTGLTNIASLSISSDGQNGTVLTWVADQPSSTRNIFAQRIDASGASRWLTNGMRVDSTTANANQTVPSVCSDASGGAVVAWLDGRNANPTVFVQHITSNGTRAWLQGGIAVVSPTSGAQGSPRLLADDNGGAFVSWEHPQTNTTTGFQHFDATGTALYTPAFVPTTLRSENAVMTRTGSASLLVAWYLSAGGEIHGTMLNATGVAASSTTLLATSSTKPISLVPRSDGGAILVSADSPSVHVLRLDANGALVGSPAVAFAGQSMGASPILTAVTDAADGAFVVWISSTRAYMRHLRSTLVADGTGRTSLSGGVSSAQSGAVAVGGVDLLAAWMDDRNGGSNIDLFAQRASNTGVAGNYHRILTSIAAGSGSILPFEGRIYVNDGANLSLRSDGTGGHYVDRVVVGTTNFAAVPNYTFHNVTGDSTFTAYFSNAPIVTTVQAVANSYRAFSLPIVLANDTLAVALANLMPYDNTRWRFGHWVASDSAYAEPGIALRRLLPGTGYWFLGGKDTTLSFSGLGTPQTLFTLPMLGRFAGRGWTQFGSPFRFPYAVSQLIIQPGGISVPAGGNTATDRQVFEWDPSTSSYLAVNVLLPGRAYWLWRQSLTAIDLTFPFDWDPVAVNAAPGLPAGATWALSVRAASGSREARLTLGAGDVAASVWNPLSSRAIPSPGEDGLSLTATVTDWGADDGDYQTMFRPDGETLAWDLSASAKSGLTETALTFADLPAGRHVVLSEPAAGWSREVRAGEPISLVLTSSPRRLRLEVTTSALAPPRVPTVTALRALGPNPFRDAAALSLALGHDSVLRWDVFDLAGRRMRSEARALSAGEHTLVWDGRDADGRKVAPGLYLVRWQADGASGAVRLVRAD